MAHSPLVNNLIAFAGAVGTNGLLCFISLTEAHLDGAESSVFDF